MQAPEWQTSAAPVAYPAAIAAMEARVAAIRAGAARELVWLLEHPPLYTAGTSADPAELLAPGKLPVYRSGRGGRFTYHGPGQRVAYVLLDLRRRGRDVRRFVKNLERWVVASLADFGVRGTPRVGRIGIWVDGGGQDQKIAALGVRIRHWVTYHGIAINVDPDLRAYDGIVPCGIRGYGVTSLAALRIEASLSDVDAALRSHFAGAFEAVPAPA